MALSNAEAISKFINPITSYVSLGRIQKAILQYSATTDSLSAFRALSMMYDTDVGPLMDTAILPVHMDNLTDTELTSITSAQIIFEAMAPLENIIRSAVNESEKFLPLSTIELLREYDTEGAPLDRYAVATFIVMATNLQD